MLFMPAVDTIYRHQIYYRIWFALPSFVSTNAPVSSPREGSLGLYSSFQYLSLRLVRMDLLGNFCGVLPWLPMIPTFQSKLYNLISSVANRNMIPSIWFWFTEPTQFKLGFDRSFAILLILGFKVLIRFAGIRGA